MKKPKGVIRRRQSKTMQWANEMEQNGKQWSTQ